MIIINMALHLNQATQMEEDIKVLCRESRKLISDALQYDEQNKSADPKCLALYKKSQTFLKTALEKMSSQVGDHTRDQIQQLLLKVDERICILEKKYSQDDSLRNIDQNLGDIILNEVMQSGLTTRFSDIVGNHSAKEALRESVILPSLRPDIFTGLRSPNKGILLLGAPGNGKTLLAEACAVESGCRFFNISSSCLMSKWVGESEKLMRTLFVLARELQPSIIFFDEVDSMLSSRKSGEHDTSRRLKTEFLSRFGGAGTSNGDGVLVIGATNRPQDIDDAVVRRFPKRILVDMPLESERKEMLSLFISKVRHVLSPEDFNQIAMLTNGYSGSDLYNLTKDAAYQAVRGVEPDLLKTIDKEDIRPTDIQDFILSLEKSRPSVKNSTLKALQKWLDKT
jgi:spastin